MTRHDRDALAKNARLTEKVAKTGLVMRAAVLRAEFEKQLNARYSFNQRDVWKKAYALAQDAVAKANEAVAKESIKLGIMPEFAPRVCIGWDGEGERAVKERRAQLRQVAVAHIDAMAKEGKFKIEQSSLDVQTKLLAEGLESDDAKKFLESMPTPEQLMPPLSLDEIEVTNRKQLAAGRRYQVGEDDEN